MRSLRETCYAYSVANKLAPSCLGDIRASAR